MAELEFMTKMSLWLVVDKFKAQRGVAIPEYAILLGLVLVLAMGGITMLGDSTKNLLSLTGNTVNRIGGGSRATVSSALPLITVNASASSASHVVGSSSRLASQLKGRGYYNMVIDPTTGQPTLRLVKGSSGVNINVNSVEGSRYNVLGTIMLAKKLDEMAAQKSDSQVKDYYARLAKYAYYLGGAEGVMDNVSQVAWNNVAKGQWDSKTGVYQTYTLGDGLRDVFSYQQQLQVLLTNPPDNLNNQELKQVMPFATDALNIAKNYLNTFDAFIGPNGEVPKNFGDPGQCGAQNQSSGAVGGCNLGNPGPGASLTDASKAVVDPPNGHEMLGISYDALVPLSQLKLNAELLLADHSVTAIPVVATFTAAQAIDVHAISAAASER
jgi:Flp pilus assembly pilin Flp